MKWKIRVGRRRREVSSGSEFAGDVQMRTRVRRGGGGRAIRVSDGGEYRRTRVQRYFI